MTGRHPVCFVRLLSGIGLAVAIAATASAQSLGDLAKKEEARRKAIKAPGKVLTTDSIQRVPAPALPATTASSTPDKDKEKDKSDAEAGSEKPKSSQDPKAGEAAWRARMQNARETLQRSQMFAEALQSRINGLIADFTSRDDPAQRTVLANDRDKALAELNRVKDDIVKQTKAISDIQDEARKSGVPPGWVR
jgi:hypothetical protein